MPVRWLACGEDALPVDDLWLAPEEAARLARLRYPKRRTEYLLRRLVAKHAVALDTGWPTDDPVALARIEVLNAASGAPYVLVDGAPLGTSVSISDRAGWAVCVLGGEVGADLELVEQRSPTFLRIFLTEAERRFVAAWSDGDGCDAAANLVWSAKESALKVLRTGLRRDTRDLDVTIERPRADGWGALVVRVAGEAALPGWWRRDGRFVFTVAARQSGPPPGALGDPRVLAAAAPVHSWLHPPATGPSPVPGRPRGTGVAARR